MSSDLPDVLVSVVMPCFNAGLTLQRSVSSVLSQTYQNLELIVVDDGSTDDSLEQLRAISDSRLRVVQAEHGGVCLARNRALEIARGELVAFLDADDWWDTTFLEKLAARLAQDSDAAIAYCGWKNEGLEGPMGEPFMPQDFESGNKMETLLRGCPWPIHAAVTRREAIRRVGGFDSRFAIGEDFFLWLSIAMNHRVSRVGEVLAYYYHHAGTRATSEKDKVAMDTWRVQRTFIAEHVADFGKLDVKHLRHLPEKYLMQRGFDCYWKGELEQSRKIFRLVMKQGYGSRHDWLYMLPSWLPLPIHSGLLKIGRSSA